MERQFNFDLERMRQAVSGTSKRIPTLEEICQEQGLDYEVINQNEELAFKIFSDYLDSYLNEEPFNFNLAKMTRLVEEKGDVRVPTLKEMCEQNNLDYDEVSKDKALSHSLFCQFLKSL